jgi:hypothetical protein
MKIMSHLPPEYDTIKNWAALQLSIAYDYPTDVALRKMRADPQRPLADRITNDDITAMIQFQNDGMELAEISKRFYITPEECANFITEYRKYYNDKYLKKKEKAKQKK